MWPEFSNMNNPCQEKLNGNIMKITDVNKHGHSHSTTLPVWRDYVRQLSALTLPFT